MSRDLRPLVGAFVKECLKVYFNLFVFCYHNLFNLTFLGPKLKEIPNEWITFKAVELRRGIILSIEIHTIITFK